MKGDKFHYNQKLNQMRPVNFAEDVNFLPTCSDRLTVNCQPVCTESETTGCTEIRTPAPLPMRNWDFKDRFEGRKTQQ